MREIFKNLIFLFLLACSLGMAERPTLEQGGKIQVVTSIPDLADFTARIGGRFCFGGELGQRRGRSTWCADQTEFCPETESCGCPGGIGD